MAWLDCQPKNDVIPINTTIYSSSLVVTTFDAGIKINKNEKFCLEKERKCHA